MKEITVVGYCDHDHESRVRSTVERTLSVDGSKPVALDLCDEHDALVKQMLDMMDRGVVVKGAPKKRASSGQHRASGAGGSGTYHEPTGVVPPLEGPHVCPECGFESATRGALGQHLTTKHEKGFRDYASNVA